MGVVKKKCCMIVVYQFFLLIFLALFLFLGITSKIVPDKVFEGDCKNSPNSLIESAYKLYNKSDEYFCKSYCECSISNTSLSKYSDSER